ncbi:hypothetical protein PspLS_02303 [Pyricularia sp. CBS 133598]|nr:hypothetical protein PspLS_02303 [Pyricularia sp. CBS 133598]
MRRRRLLGLRGGKGEPVAVRPHEPAQAGKEDEEDRADDDSNHHIRGQWFHGSTCEPDRQRLVCSGASPGDPGGGEVVSVWKIHETEGGRVQTPCDWRGLGEEEISRREIVGNTVPVSQ